MMRGKPSGNKIHDFSGNVMTSCRPHFFSNVYLLLTSRKGLLTSRKGITNIEERVTGDATYISGKHWQQTLANNGVRLTLVPYD